MTRPRTFPRGKIDRIIDQLPGRIGVVVKDLSTGEAFEHDPHGRYATASVFKLPIMVELFRQAEAGRVSLEDRHRPREGVSGVCGGHIRLAEDEPERSLREYCLRMIALSDNLSTDLILDVIGLESVNATLDELGFVNTRVSMTIGRWHYTMVGLGETPISAEYDRKAQERSRAGRVDLDSLSYRDSRANNVASAADMAVMLERIYRGELISPEASSTMLEMLRACENRRMIPRHLDPSIAVAHKIGQSHHIRADVGIVFLPGRPLVISALSFAMEEGEQRPGVDAIAGISRAVVEALCPEAVFVRAGSEERDR